MHLIHQLGAGGAENGIINIVNHIDQSKIESAICAFVGQGTQEGRVRTPQTRLFDLNKKPGNDFGLPFRLRRLLKSWQPDVLHTHAWGTLCEGFLAAKMAGVSSIVHGEHGTIQEKARNLPIQRYFWGLTDQLLSVSEAHKMRLSKTVGYPVDNIQVIQNGVDTAHFCYRKKNTALQEMLGLNKEHRIVGTVGRFMPVKNQDFLIKAFRGIVETDDYVSLLLVGDGPLKESLVSLASSLGVLDRVVFSGRRSDVSAVLNLMDVFVLPSLSEGMSNTILEAMSCALPVIATDVGGNPALVKHKKSGLLVPSDDIFTLASAIGNLLKHPELRSVYGQAGRALVESEYSLNKMVSRYEGLYGDLFKQKGSF